ncbi:hypothetical protein [Parasitella parasitica]|uniref:Uncharacterized protein n=1 Tax=Parasitella parasitica TaxID=35722 RepID=A0A0B7MYK0_9FUNG|nr:hypothetical protein [Parasitella parasitica]
MLEISLPQLTCEAVSTLPIAFLFRLDSAQINNGVNNAKKLDLAQSFTTLDNLQSKVNSPIRESSSSARSWSLSLVEDSALEAGITLVAKTS